MVVISRNSVFCFIVFTPLAIPLCCNNIGCVAVPEVRFLLFKALGIVLLILCQLL